jgi:hypothetical protein
MPFKSNYLLNYAEQVKITAQQTLKKRYSDKLLLASFLPNLQYNINNTDDENHFGL